MVTNHITEWISNLREKREIEKREIEVMLIILEQKKKRLNDLDAHIEQLLEKEGQW